MSMDYAEWSRRLTETFTANGLFPSAYGEVLGAEAKYADAIDSLATAHALIFNSFQSFWIETLHLALQEWPHRPASGSTEYYGAVLQDHIVQF
jgi:hypothetical protein